MAADEICRCVENILIYLIKRKLGFVYIKNIPKQNVTLTHG